MKEGWIYSTIDESCNVNYGTRVVRSEVTGDKYPVYGGGGETFRMDEYNREDCLVVSRFAMSKQCTRIVRGKFYLNDSGLTVSPKPTSGLLPNLLDRYLLASNDIIYSFGRGSAQRNLNMVEFRKLKISYPISLKEQQSIVEYLDSSFAKIDAMKANAEKALNEAKALFQASLKSLLEPKEGWKVCFVKDVCSKITDGTHHSPINFPNGDYKYITAKNIKPWGLDLCNITYVPTEIHKEIYSRCNPSKDDVLYIKDGATTGIAIVNPLDEEFSMLSSVALLKPIGNIVLSQFLCYILNSPSVYEQARSKMDGAAITRVTLKKIKEFTIELPSTLEQQAIVTTLDSLKAKVSRLQSNFDKITQECDALKQALLKQVFE